MSVKLRPYQQKAIERIEARPERRILVASPTGSGKTVLMSEMAKRATEAGKYVLMVAPRHELIDQLCSKLDDWCEFKYGVISAQSRKPNLYAKVQVASVDTLTRRVLKDKKIEPPRADVIFIDEAHLYITENRLELMELYPDAKIYGFTATPGRFDGRGMGNLFDKLIAAATIKQLVDEGYLVLPKYLAPSAPDMARVKTRMGDWDQGQAAERMMPLLGDIVGHWMRHAGGRRTVLFASKIEQSVYMAEEFRKAGVAAEHCDGTMSTTQRDEIFDRFRSGETQMLCNVDLATYGFDLPELDCIVMARPTKSIVKYIQMIGRGMRIAPGKSDCLVLDHAGNVHYHGFVEEERYWSLNGVRDPKATYKDSNGEVKRKPFRNLTCPKCSTVFIASLTCPSCGHHFTALAERFIIVDGDLIPFDDENKHELSPLEQMRFFTELLWYAKQKNYRIGWAAYAYQERFKTWPPRQWNTYDPTPISLATQRFITHLNIKRARSKASSPLRANARY